LLVRLRSNGPDETFGFGAKLGGLLRAGDTVCLFGDLGAGKTVFVKGVASALGISEREITSASFTIVAEYTGKLGNNPVPFYHIDLYRIGSANELDSIGLEEYIGKDGIAVVEWAEKLGDVEKCITVRFHILDGEKRDIDIEGIDEAHWHNK
jgi:tRNA threonylcarbamoyladenosine biosynthesis protein TsaE